MGNAIGLSIIIMLVCFNAGLFIVDASGLYSGVEIPDGSLPSDLSSGVDVTMVVAFSLTTLAGALGIGIAGGLLGADPLRCAGIGAFVGSILVLFANSYKVINEVVANLAPSSSIGATIAMAFIGVEAILVLLFLYQLATGGWASYLKGG